MVRTEPIRRPPAVRLALITIALTAGWLLTSAMILAGRSAWAAAIRSTDAETQPSTSGPIAAQRLSPGAGSAELADGWSGWFAVRRPEIGPDPHPFRPAHLRRPR